MDQKNYFGADPAGFDSIIFDIDGTLWDASDSLAHGWREGARLYYDPDYALTGPDILPILGKPPRELAAALFPDVPEPERDELFARVSDASIPVMESDRPLPYDGVPETIRALSSSCRLFIVSNCARGYAEMFLRVTGLADLFDGHLCPHDTGMEKAENIALCAQRWQLRAPVYVGDTQKDRLSAKAAGVPFIFASYGFGSVTDYDAVINDPSELAELLLRTGS